MSNPPPAPRPSLQPETLRAVTSELEEGIKAADRVRGEMPSSTDLRLRIEVEAMRDRFDRALLRLGAMESQVNEIKETTAANLQRPGHVPPPPQIPTPKRDSNPAKSSGFRQRYGTAMLLLIGALTTLATNLAQYFATRSTPTAEERRDHRRPPPPERPPDRRGPE